MRNLVVAGVFLSIAASCRNTKIFTILELRIDSRKQNRKILDRFPDYGDGRRDGCIVLTAMSVDLHTKNKGWVVGTIADVTKGHTLSDVRVSIVLITGDTLRTKTDSVGSFSVSVLNTPILLQAEHEWYRVFAAKL